MYIITVIPIGRGIGKDTLTYFTSQNISHGSVVTVPVRNSTAHGIVIHSTSVTENKSEIKNLSFSIKKINTIETHNFLSKEFIQACKKISDYYATTIGSILFTLIPKTILETHTEYKSNTTESDTHTYYETTLLQADTEERYATYKSLIREEFAKGKSVFFCVPTIEDIKNAHSVLERGIEKYTYTLHSSLSKKDIVSVWQNILSESHPVVIIGTGQYICVPRSDIKTYIVEKESSRAYYSQSRPYLDMRLAIQMIGRENNARVIFGDNLLRIETLWKQKMGEYSELSPLKFRSLSTTENNIVSMRTPKEFSGKSEGEFTILSPELKDMLTHAQEASERTFLFCGRKGLAPTTVCSDCGTTVTCQKCGSPVVLYSTKLYEKGNIFMCNHCGEKRPADMLCSHCSGWRLTTLGIGIDRVAQEIQSLFPNTTLFIMDKDHITTQKQAVKSRNAFFSTPGSICIGTEMALPYLTPPSFEKIENSAVVSLDSFFSIPDFKINEKIFHILLDMRSCTQNKILVQTRQPESSPGWKLFEHALKGNLFDFYRTEIDDRKSADYPPFVTFIKITLRGDKKAIRDKTSEIEKDFAPYEMLLFETTGKGGVQSIHGILTLPHGTWIDVSILEKLRKLPHSVEIKIDPDTLL